MDSQHIIVINGNEFAFDPGETILQAARRNHIDIPTLCHLEGAKPTGECGMCVVEIEGERELKCACSTSAANNAVVRTESAKVIEARRKVLREMLASGYHNCAARGSDSGDWTKFQIDVQKGDASPELCPVWGDCELQDLAFRYHVSGERMPRPDEPYPMETVNPFIVRDFSRCIKCGRCVKACNEIQVNNAIKFGEGDPPERVITEGDKPLKDSECVFCGECVQVCPVGALVEKDVRYNVRPWETEKIATTCSYCGVGCQMYLHVRDGKIVRVSGMEGIPPNYGSLCVKGRFGFNFVDSPERLTKPLVRKNGELTETTWDEALSLAASRLGEIKSKHGSGSIGVLTSARITNEDNYISQKFARAVIKTNNVDHCARL